MADEQIQPILQPILQGTPQTAQEAQSATRLAAVEVHVHYIKEAVARLENTVNQTNSTIQSSISKAMEENAKRTELMIANLTLQLAGQRENLAMQLSDQKEKVGKLDPIREQVLKWMGGFTLAAFLTGIIITLAIFFYKMAQSGAKP